MDALSDLLLSIRVLTTSVGIMDFGPDSGVAMPALDQGSVLCTTLIDGPCWMQMGDRAPVRLEPLDSVLTLGAQPHSFLPSIEARPRSVQDLFEAHGIRRLRLQETPTAPIIIRDGAGAPRTRLLSMMYLLQALPRGFPLASLPSLMVVKRDANAALPWIPASLDFVATEAANSAPGFIASATKLAELMFTNLLRAYAVEHDAGAPNWLRAMSDPRIANALSLIHARPTHPWSVSELAEVAGMARSSFAAKFVALLGRSPIEYLLDIRMQRVAERLLQEGARIGALAEEFGYGSERAFRHAFKARFGVSPRRYARSVRQSN